MDLSAYLNFSIVLDYASGELRLTDTSTYPGGVRDLVSGKVVILQPDQLTTAGSFSDVTWDGTALTVAQKELRLSTKGKPQNGTYRITYTVNDGTDDTELTKEFTLSYTRPTLVLTKAFDVFTPNLSIIDSTDYAINETIQGVEREWTATVGSVGEVGGTAQVLDLAKSGSYYDAAYIITLISTVEYDINNWVKLFDNPSKTVEYTANTPPTLAELREDLAAMKSYKVNELNEDYIAASSIFQNLIDRGKNQDLDGLDEYITELQKYLNNNITPSYTNTNEVIPAYDWGSAGAGVVVWDDVLSKPPSNHVAFKVGDTGYPSSGNTYQSAAIAGKQVLVFRGGVVQRPSNPGDGGSYYEKTLPSDTVTFYPAFYTGDEIQIIVLGL